jgi:hypothetical protein
MVLCHCSPSLPGRADGIDPNPFNLLETQATAVNRDPSRIVIPMLHSPVLEKRWGKPRLLVGPKGGYALRYGDPSRVSRHVTIFGSPEKFNTAGSVPPPYTELGHDKNDNTFNPVEVSQKWQFVEIAGKNVRFYISQGASGNEPMQYSTETFRLKAPDGRTASYRIRVSTDGRNPDHDVPTLMRTASF